MKPRTLTRSLSASSAENRPAKPKPKRQESTEPKVAGQRKRMLARGHKLYVDRAGEVHGRLTILKSVQGKFFCRCSCGSTKWFQGGNVIKGVSASCGCLQKELVSRRATKHGQTKGGRSTKLHQAWMSMKARCYGRGKRTEIYRIRGIQVSDYWLCLDHGFQRFAAEVGDPPTRFHTIERTDNSGHYVPGNVRWATRKEQGNNKSVNFNITFSGKTLNLHQWSQELGINRGTLWSRLRSLRWDTEKAFTKPVKHEFRNSH